MRKYTVVFGVIALLSASALGQSTRRFDAFGGYSYLHSDPGSGLRSADASGWVTSLNWNWNRWLSLKSDFSGSYCCTGQRETSCSGHKSRSGMSAPISSFMVWVE